MPASHVFLVHGIGRHPAATWSNSWTAAILGALRNYAPYDTMSDGDLAQHLVFHPVSYDAHFETIRGRWTGLAAALADNEVVADPRLHDALAWVAAADVADPDKADFIWDNVLDAVLWYGFPLARMRVIAGVVADLVTGVREMYAATGGDNTAHILAHSLGTSVVHDALVSLFHADRIHEGAFDSRQHRWRSVTMVSNTSRLLKTYVQLSDDATIADYDPYTSCVNPGVHDPAVCMQYANVFNHADPIAWPWPFAPDGWPRSRYRSRETVRYSELRKIHDLEHYLANPRVHLPFLRTVLENDQLGTQAEIDSVVEAFEAAHPHEAADEFADIRAFFGGNREKPLNVRDMAEFLYKTYKELT